MYICLVELPHYEYLLFAHSVKQQNIRKAYANSSIIYVYKNENVRLV